LKRVGIVPFMVNGGGGELDELATEILTEKLRKHLKGTEVITVANPRDFEGIEFSELPKSACEFAVSNELDAVFLGEIIVSDFQSILKSPLRGWYPGITTKFRMTIAMKLFQVETGALLWEGDVSKVGHASYCYAAKRAEPRFYISKKNASQREFLRKLLFSLVSDVKKPKNPVEM